MGGWAGGRVGGWAGDTDINIFYTYTLFSLNISKIPSTILNFYAFSGFILVLIDMETIMVDRL